MKTERKEKIVEKLYGILFVAIIVLLFLMIAGIVIFFLHYSGDIGELWNSDAGKFVFGLFSAFFTGLNVFAFVLLTHAINRNTRNIELVTFETLQIISKGESNIYKEPEETSQRYKNIKRRKSNK